MQPTTRRPLLQHVELMPQDQDLGFLLPLRFGEVAEHAKEQEPDCDHWRSCSDSGCPRAK
jgi:hypothetical protein